MLNKKLTNEPAPIMNELEILRKSQMLSQLILDNAHDLVAIHNMGDLSYEYVNPATLEVLGYSQEELFAKSALELVHPDDMGRVMNSIKDNLPKGEGRDEFRYLKKDGSYIWLEVTGTILAREQDESAMIIISRDITRRKQAEAALRRQIEAQALLLEISKQYANSNIQETDAMINTTLRLIGQFDNSDRSFVFLLSDDQYTISNAYQWCAEGISPQNDSLQGLPVNVLPWWSTTLQNLDYLYIPRVEARPSEDRSEKEILQAQSILSLIVVPMFWADKIIGFLGFDSVRSERNWTNENIVMLESAAQIIVASLQRKKNAQALQHSENYYRTIFIAMIQAENEMELLLNFCQKLIEVGRYKLAWVGYVREDEQQKVWPAAYAGTDSAYLAKLNISLQDPRRGRGPVGTAIRSGQPIVSPDFKKDDTFKPWLRNALRRGFKSCIALPLTTDNNVFGVLSIYADQTDVFNSREQKLLMDMANNLAHAIMSMRARNKKTEGLKFE